jgi:DNA-binding protein Fis
MSSSIIKEKIYSKAFEDGVDYAIEKMFAELKGGYLDDIFHPINEEQVDPKLKKLSDYTKNDEGQMLSLLGIGGGGISGYYAGRRGVRQGILRGDSDEDILKRAKRDSLVTGVLVHSGTGVPLIWGLPTAYYSSKKNAKEAIRLRKEYLESQKGNKKEKD